MDRPKALVELAGRTLLQWSVNALHAVPAIEQIVVAPKDPKSDRAVPRKLGKVGCNVAEQLERSKSNDLWRLIYGLGIRHIGEKAAATLARAWDRRSSPKLPKLSDCGKPCLSCPRWRSLWRWFYMPAHGRLPAIWRGATSC